MSDDEQYTGLQVLIAQLSEEMGLDLPYELEATFEEDTRKHICMPGQPRVLH